MSVCLCFRFFFFFFFFLTQLNSTIENRATNGLCDEQSPSTTTTTTHHVASWGQSQKRPPPYAAHQQRDRRVNMRQGQDSGGIKGCNETYQQQQQQQQQYFSVTTQKRRRTRATPPAVAIFFLVSLVFINHSTETLRINTNPTPESKASSSPSSSCYHYYYSFSCAASPRQILSNSLLPPNVCTLTPHIRETSGIQFQKQIQSDDDDVGEAHRFVFFTVYQSNDEGL